MRGAYRCDCFVGSCCDLTCLSGARNARFPPRCVPRNLRLKSHARCARLLIPSALLWPTPDHRLLGSIAPRRTLTRIASSRRSRLLATRAAIRAWNHTGNAVPHIFGAKLTATDLAVRGRPGDTSCELDLLLFGDSRGQPQVIVGEVKHRGRVEEADLNNMRAVQEWFASQDIDCWPLFATLRSSLDASEVELLRVACETAPRARGSMIVPQFPIILLAPELSAPWMDDDSITKWCSSRSAGDLAVASCARNLGLQQFDWSPTPSPNWVCQWSPHPSAVP